MPSLSASLGAALPFLFLASIRVGITFASLPPPFGSVAPAASRLALKLLVSFALSIATFNPSHPIPIEPLVLAQMALSEWLIGSVFGMTVCFIFAAAEI